MNDWYASLSGLEQTLFLVAVFSTGIFVIQLAATLFGIGGDDVDFDSSSDGSSLDFGDIFSIRNGVTFLMGFSWGGLMAFDWGLTHEALVVLVGSVVGVLFVIVNILLFLGLSKIRSQGNIDMDNAIDATGNVSLTIPSQRSGVGKVMISIQGRLKEYHAITDGEEIPKNASIVVDELSGSQLVVSRA